MVSGGCIGLGGLLGSNVLRKRLKLHGKTSSLALNRTLWARKTPNFGSSNPETGGIECFTCALSIFYVGWEIGRVVGLQRSRLIRSFSLFQLGLAEAWPLEAALSQFRLEPETRLLPVATRASLRLEPGPRLHHAAARYV